MAQHAGDPRASGALRLRDVAKLPSAPAPHCSTSPCVPVQRTRVQAAAGHDGRASSYLPSIAIHHRRCGEPPRHDDVAEAAGNAWRVRARAVTSSLSPRSHSHVGREARLHLRHPTDAFHLGGPRRTAASTGPTRAAQRHLRHLRQSRVCAPAVGVHTRKCAASDAYHRPRQVSDVPLRHHSARMPLPPPRRTAPSAVTPPSPLCPLPRPHRTAAA